MKLTVLPSLAPVFVILAQDLFALAYNMNNDTENLENSLSKLRQTVTKLESELDLTKSIQKWAVDELETTKNELLAVKTQLLSTSAQLNSAMAILSFFEDKWKNETKSQTKIVVAKDHQNIGFLMSSNFGDNGYNHNGLVYVVNNRSNLVFPDTTLNHGNSYHVNNGTMTAPVTGIYLIWVNVNMATPHFTVSLKKTPTGEVIKEGLSHQKNVEFMTPVYLVQGEGVVVQIQGEALVYPDTPLSEFGGVLIRGFDH